MDILIKITCCLITLINPQFTPVHLVNQSIAVVELRFDKPVDGSAQAASVKVWKGAHKAAALSFTMTSTEVTEQGDELLGVLAEHENSKGLLFIGGADGDGDSALLHIQGEWVNFTRDGTQWSMTSFNSDLATTWSGATDMLIRATAYITEDPDAMIPVVESAGWNEFPEEPFANLGESVHAAQMIDLSAAQLAVLHVSSTDGDHLFHYDAAAGNMRDISEESKLDASSRVAVWADAHADGRMDLFSWNGNELMLHQQVENGIFSKGHEQLAGKLVNGCLSLSPISGKDGQLLIVIGTRAEPLLWDVASSELITIGGDFKGEALGASGLCLVADFNNDNHVDVLQVLRKGSLLYAGVDLGTFAVATPINIMAKDDDINAFIGDFDADGLFDVYVVGPDQGTSLWANRGDFHFDNVFRETGEMNSKGSEDAISGTACDFNNDGRQDVIFFYDMGAPRLFFNRGFRSFGLANGMDISKHNLIEEALDGSQAGCVADFNGDGCQDVVVIHGSGNAHFLPISLGEETAGCAQVVLPHEDGLIGPMRVTAWRDEWCLGSWNVSAGQQGAFFGQCEAGPLTIKWSLPDGTEQEVEVIVENEPQRVVIE